MARGRRDGRLGQVARPSERRAKRLDRALVRTHQFALGDVPLNEGVEGWALGSDVGLTGRSTGLGVLKVELAAALEGVGDKRAWGVPDAAPSLEGEKLLEKLGIERLHRDREDDHGQDLYAGSS